MLNSLSIKSTLVIVLGLFACVLLPSFAAADPNKMANKQKSMSRKSVETAADSGDYVYKQKFIPTETMEIDLSKTAFFVTDPQNDFLSEASPAWGLVGPTVIRHKVVEKEKTLKALAKKMGIPLFYSTHMYTPKDFEQWPKNHVNGIDKIMFDLHMFAQREWGHEIHPDLLPDSHTIVMNPHKGLSNFWTGDAAIQLRRD